MDNISSDVRYSVLREKTSEWQPDNEIELNMEAVYANTTSSSPAAVMQQSSSSSSSSANSRRNQQTEMEAITHDEQVELAVTSSGVASRGSSSALDHSRSPRVSLSNAKLANYSADTTQIPGIQYLNAANLTDKLKKRRTLLEKIQFVIILLLVVVLFALFVTLVNLRQKIQEEQLNKTSNASSSSNRTDYCNSYRCILVSGSMYKSINKKIDPCDDFYEYACGGWIKKNLIPTGFPRWGTLNLITYENQLLIKDQLELNRSAPEITEAEVKARTFYKSCLDREGIIEKLGAKPLMNILNKIIYKAPDNKLVINESFSNLLSLIQITYGLNSLFEFNVLDDDKNSSYSNIEIIQGSLGLDRSFYINNQSEKNAKAMEIYKKTIVNVINLLFDKVENANEEMENLIKFETSMANIMLPNDKLSEVESIYSRVKIGDLNNNYATFFDWKNFFNIFLKTYGSNEVLKDNDEIIIMGLEYFISLNKLIKEYQDTGREKTVKLSVIFHLIKFSLPLLSKEYRAELTTLGEALTGSITVERWQTCIEHTDNIFGLGYAITRMFIRASPNNAKIEAQKMIRSIKHSFIENFPKIAWMDEETRHLAEEKVNSVDDLIGYPDFIENDEQLNGRYKDLEIKEDDYFGNEIRLVQYALRSEILTYRTRVNRAEWEMTSSAVNAYYSPTRNQIVFPSGILQDPFFHPENPMSINYGSIGTIMGHELTHGFDDSGREYDKSGMMKQWWNNQTVENFKNASKCMIQQYSQYKIEEESLNGKQTLGENIADNGGLRAAFYAYEKWMKEHGEEKPLPLLGLSHRQLFFVSFAQTWCSKSTADSLHLSLSVDQHSPPRFRVIGTISNSFEFAKAFKCPANSRMNPQDKCKIW